MQHTGNRTLGLYQTDKNSHTLIRCTHCAIYLGVPKTDGVLRRRLNSIPWLASSQVRSKE